MTYQEEFITFMVRAGVLTFGDFTTKSGRRTPYFINTGNYKTAPRPPSWATTTPPASSRTSPTGGLPLRPRYKGIPLAVSAAASLYRNYGRDLPYCFNRKEAKDHGEGGVMVGCKPQDGDRVVIVEDVVTAGTAVRESIELFQHVADVKMRALSSPWTDGAGHPGLLHPGRAAGGLRHRRLPHRHRPGDHRLSPQPGARRQGVY